MNRSRTYLSDVGHSSWTYIYLFNGLWKVTVKSCLRESLSKIKPTSNNSRSVQGIRNQGVRDRQMEKLDAERSAARKPAQSGLSDSARIPGTDE